MGKRIITQRRGKGGPPYKSPSHRYIGQIKHKKLDNKKDVLYGRILDLIHSSAHSAPVAKIKYDDGTFDFIIAPQNIKVNEVIAFGNDAPVQIGNTLPLEKIPEGTIVYNIEKLPGDGGKFCRSGGSFAKITARLGSKTIILLPSKKQLTIDSKARASIGVVAGAGRKEKPLVKAGRKYHAMRARNKLYPRTSGVAMNAVDHPYGSGRGRHMGKSGIPPRGAPPGRNVGLIRARRTGRKQK